MRFFTKNEIIGIGIIFSVVFAVTLRGLLLSERRARDAQRKGDLGAISDALYKYFNDFGYFPPSEEGKIKACKDDNFDEVIKNLQNIGGFDSGIYFSGLRVCNWGIDPIRDPQDEYYEAYLSTLPSDPYSDRALSYFYISNTRRFQIYAHLEGGSDEGGYNESIVARNLKCGDKVCSFGKSYAETPLDRSIEDYEQELLEKSGSGSE